MVVEIVTLNEIQEVPSNNMILLVGPPGTGKSAFCEQVVLQSLSIDRSTIFVMTGYDPSKTKKDLKKRGLGEIEPGLLNFIDAYNETVGLSVSDQQDIVYANCYDLSSIDIAISKLQDRIDKKGTLLVFDSLTSPYIFNGSEILRFMSQTLSRFAAKGNAVIVCIDEGCGKEEDLVAMMSQAHGIIKIEMEDGQRIFNVIKHPKIEPVKIPFPGKGDVTPIPYESKSEIRIKYAEADRYTIRSMSGKLTARKKMGDWVNILWYQLIFWGCIQWDPKRFPSLLYNLTKDRVVEGAKYMKYMLSWSTRLLMPLVFRLLIPKKWSVKAVKRLWDFAGKQPNEGHFVMEYLDKISRDDEHHFRKTEGAGCWGFPNVGAAICFHEAAELAGPIASFDRQGLDWDCVEYMCIGRGDPYCQLKVTPEKSREFQEFIGGFDSSKLEKINEHIMGRILSLVLHGETLPRRPTLGMNVIHLHEIQGDTSRGAVFSEYFQTVLRMAGANSGRKIAKLLLDNGLKEAETTKGLIDLFQFTKAGELAVGETVRIEENCESYGLKLGQSLCFFTTGFLNGFFTVTRNQHLKEVRCVADGSPYCEWEFR
ncbi:MAG: ATPase domain-containing protein [Promethearchaeota archaeon]|jgi:predicted hydrocarbon binding protein/KaiC/GvpD/RAD55 family RecA-like ATPase